jgi:hypothetical protein
MDGMLGYIGVGSETTWGTAVAPQAYVEAMNESITTTIDRFETRNIITGLYEPDDADGVRHHEGDIVMGFHPVTMGYFMKAAFGINSSTVVSAAALWANRFYPVTTLANSLHPLPSYSIEVLRPCQGMTSPSSAFRYSGAQVSKLSWNYKPNQDVEVTASIIAKDMALATKATPTYVTSPTQMFTFDTASIQLPSGTAVAHIEDLTIEIDNQLEGVATLNNSTTISRIRRTGPQLIRVSGSFEFDTFTDFLNFTTQAEQRMVVSVARSTAFSLVVDMPRIVFTEMPVQIGGRERLTVNFAAMARYHTGSVNAITANLTTTNTF